MKVAIIGAGISGICATKSCLESGHIPVCFEKSDDIGGLWCFRQEVESGKASVMKSTVINTSKEMMAFSDFPPPGEYPAFMHHTKVLEYMRKYADHFELLPHIHFNTEVKSVKRSDDYDHSGRWIVAYQRKGSYRTETDVFDGVMVCNGHHGYPYQPEIPGQETFRGRIMHSHSYKTTAGFEDKNVVVVGVGNSGGDIATELGYRIAKNVYLSSHRGFWVHHRVNVWGYPYDMLYFNRIGFWMLKNMRWLAEWLTRSELNRRISHGLFGLLPPHGVYATHPTVNDSLPQCICSGAVVLKPQIETLTEKGVKFVDGSVADDVDVVILATGYSMSFPVLEEDIIPVEENDVNLYLHMYPPDLPHPTLGVIGLIQPYGSVQAIAELQTRVFVKVLEATAKLPQRSEMLEDIKEKRATNLERYVNSRRHTVQVDMGPYMMELAHIIGVEPPSVSSLVFKDYRLAKYLLIGPSLPYVYRLRGSNAWPGARDAILGSFKRVFRPHYREELKGQGRPTRRDWIRLVVEKTPTAWINLTLALLLYGGLIALGIWLGRLF